MDINDVLRALFRWVHILAGITWIGLLYYFNLINAHFQGALEASVRKQVVPQIMPRTLFWFRWAAMYTLITGLLLILWKYFILGSGFTGESGMMTTSAGLWISLGTLFGIIMWFNVWFIIWPAQQRIITAIVGGGTPDPADPKRALLASRANTFLSVPLVFGMLAGAGHYPSIPFNLLSVGVVLAVGFGLAWYLIFKYAPTVAKTWPE